MLFFNFLCVFYLMVLINCHTISKSIANYENFDEVIDSINELDHTTEHNLRHDRYHHKYRREDTREDTAKTHKANATKKTTKTLKQASKATTENVKPITTHTLTNITHELINTAKAITTDGDLWMKLKGKLRKKVAKHTTEAIHAAQKRKSNSKLFKWNAHRETVASDNFIHFNDDNFKNKHKVEISKREAKEKSSRELSDIVKRYATAKPMNKNIDGDRQPFRTYEPVFDDDKITDNTAKISAHTGEEPKIYTWDTEKANAQNYTQLTSYASELVDKASTQITSTDISEDFMGTAAIEALLNDIKVNAIKMIADLNPGITDIITNSVTETTFEADPLLQNDGIVQASVADALLSAVKIEEKKIAKPRDIKTLHTNKTSLSTVSGAEHNINARSINDVKEKVFTVACNMEHKLQKEIKDVYCKAKHKLYQQICRELDEAKQVTKKIIEDSAKGLHGISKNISCSKPCQHKLKYFSRKVCPNADLTTLTTPTSRKHRATNTGALEKKLQETYESRTKTTTRYTLPSMEDDYAMLRLFEQVLTKTHEDNVMKMLTTQSAITKHRSLKEKFKLSKRNLESIEDLKLKENIKKLNDGEGMPDSDESPAYNDNENNSINITKSSQFDDANELYENPVTQGINDLSTEDSSFEGLTNKISFNEYVNGYKHYLKFAKELNDANFSDRIRYQAHRHHNVDDIGKYILNKIPPLPKYDYSQRSKRHFFDDSDAEDQDISTKSDDSWFKKHFYLFLDTGPQKKFHTSQTMSLKYPVGEPFPSVMEMKVDKRKDIIEDDENSNFNNVTPQPSQKYEITGNEIVDNVNDLDDMLKTLDSNKSPSSVYLNGTYETYNKEPTTKSYQGFNNIVGIKSPQYIIGKLLGRSGRKIRNKHHDVKGSYAETQIEKPDGSNRFKRNSKNEDKAVNSVGYVQKSFKHSKSTVSPHIYDKATPKPSNQKYKNYGYVDMNLVAKPTAMLKLKENKKKGKMRKLFDKLSFHKTKKKKTKRHVRKQRYSPFRRLKEMFMKGKSLSYDVDYNLMTTELNSFKIVKYNKVPSIQEMYNQVPNISLHEPGKILNVDNMWTYSHKTPVPNWSSKKLSGPVKSFSVLSDADAYDMKVKMKNFEPQDHPFSIKLSNNDNMNFMTTPSYLNNFKPTKVTISPVTIDELINAVNKMQKHVNYKNTMPEKLNLAVQTPETDTAQPYQNIKHRNVAPIGAKIKFRPRLEDMTVKAATRTTRSHSFNKKLNSAYTKPALRIDRNSHKVTRDIVRITESKKRKQQYEGKASPMISFKYKTVPDYFDDLLNWHKDILNLDKVSNPHLDFAMKTINEEVTTPNLQKLRDEISQMTNYLSGFDGIKNTKAIKKSNGTGEKSTEKIHNPKFVDRRSQASDVVNNINKLYSKSFKGYEADVHKNLAKQLAATTEKPAQANDKTATVDTTLLAYDDTINSVTEDYKTKSRFTANIKNKQATFPKPKINSRPEQYFATPVPMQKTDFDKFLKENHIDVQSVTSPFTEISKFEEDWSKRAHLKSKLMNGLEAYPKPARRFKVIEATPTTIQKHEIFANDFSIFPVESTKEREIDDEVDYLNELESNLVNEKFKELTRSKRQDNEVVDYDYLERKSENGPITKRNEIQRPMYNPADILAPNNEQSPDLDITIIDFDEKHGFTGSISGPDTSEYVQTTPSAADNFPTDTDKMIQNNVPYHPIHNKLLYNKNKDISLLKPDTFKGFNEDQTLKPIYGNYTKPQKYVPPFPTGYMKSLPKLKLEGQPKRLLISSHTYKYDVIYDEHLNKGIGNQATTRFHKVPFQFLKEHAIDTQQLITLAKVVEAVENFTRPNVIIHIDLPTYYLPNRGAAVLYSSTPSWSDQILRYLSGSPLVEMISKMKDCVECGTNTSKVSSSADGSAQEKMIGADRKRSARHVMWHKKKTTLLGSTATDSLTNLRVDNEQKSTTKRFKFLHMLEKLKLLATKKEKNTKTTKSLETTDQPVVNTTMATTPKILTTSVTTTMKDGSKKRKQRQSKDKFIDLDFYEKKMQEKCFKPKQKCEKHKLPDEISFIFPADVKDKEGKTVITTSDDVFIEPPLELASEIEQKPSSRNVTDKLSEYINELNKIIEYTRVQNPTAINTAFETLELSTKAQNDKSSFEKLDEENEELSRQLQQNKAFGLDDTTTDNNLFKDIYDVDSYDVTNQAPVEASIEESTTVHSKKTTMTKQKHAQSFVTEAKPVSMEDEGASFRKHTSFSPKRKPTYAKSTRLYKREMQPTDSTYTAKDVAALEIVVDLMKESPDDNVSANTIRPKASLSDFKETVNTNSIQVHIAIPYSSDEKKRSVEPSKLRKVFVAKMSTPVDLEYQVKSYEVNAGLEITSTTEDNLISPGMYLLVENSKVAHPHTGFALKPLKTDFVRQVNQKDKNMPLLTSTIKTTSPKNIARVTLTKEFIQSVNEQLYKLYQNLSAVSPGSNSHKVQKRSQCEKTKAKKSRILWDRVKKWLGHDRACSCKCKVNQTMCKACAASDSVMTELLFEFENLAKYMNDHCTEVQTYFWMNPTGGRKLRDIVRTIDKNLNDYYKRVKGKCQGRTCGTYQTYIDKRQFTEPYKVAEYYIGQPLIDDLKQLANDIKQASNLRLCADVSFKEAADRFIHTARFCVSRMRKRAASDGRYLKSIYSLDNINVNIICNPERSSTYSPPGMGSVLTYFTESSLPSSFLHYDDEVVTKTKIGLKRLFGKKKPKRELVVEQVESPLISDTGGAFWSEYLKSGRDDSTMTGPKEKNTLPVLQIGVLERDATDAVTFNPNVKATLVKITPLMAKAGEQSKPTEETTAQDATESNKHVLRRHNIISTTEGQETTRTESLCYNMNELIKLFESLPDVQEVKNMSIYTVLPTTLKKKKAKEAKSTTKTTTRTSTTKEVKTTQAKVNKSDKNIKQSSATSCSTAQISTNTNPQTQTSREINKKSETTAESIATDDKTLGLSPTVDSTASDLTLDDGFDLSPLESKKTANPKKSWLNKLKSIITADALQNLLPTRPVSYNAGIRETRSPEINVANLDVTSEPTTTTYPTIFIFEESPKSLKDNETVIEAKDSLLVSILKYEKVKVNDEIKRIEKKHAKNETFLEDDMNDIFFIENSKFLFTTEASTPKRTRYEGANGDYCIFSSHKKKITTPKTPKKSLYKLIQSLRKKIPGTELAGNRALKDVRAQERQVDNRWILGESISTLMVQDISTVTTSTMQTITMSDLDDITTPRTLSTTKSSTTKKATSTSKTQPSSSKATVKPKSTTTSKTTVKQVSGIKKQKEEAKVHTDEETAPKAQEKSKFVNRTEACDPRRAYCVCDIQATIDHIIEIQQAVPRREFEKYVKNITCYKYKKLPKQFIIDPIKRKIGSRNYMASKNPASRTKTHRWNWIRSKRSLLGFDDDEPASRGGDENFKEDSEDIDDSNDENGQIKIKSGFSVLEDNLVHIDSDYFERLYKGEDSIYRKRKKKRRKRAVGDMSELVLGLKNLPPLEPGPNEIYSMLGDSAVIDCSPPNTKNRHKWRGDVVWDTDRKDMLSYDNVDVRGSVVSLRNVQAKNVGNYTCSKGDKVTRMVKLSVLTLPTFRVVFIPMYDSKDGCTYDDLKALQRLGPTISEQGYGCGRDSVQINEPICLEDKDTGTTHLRVTGIMSVRPPAVRCGALCRRDLQCALALLCADNAPALASVTVLVSKNGANKSLTPSIRNNRKFIVTHTLRKKDMQDQEFQLLAASMSPGNLDVVLSCPAGYYLMPAQKICAACPADTFCAAGGNTCRACGAGAGAAPGAGRCQLSLRRLRRYDWWWYPPCGFLVAAGGVGCACAVCALAARVTSRSAARAHAQAVSVARAESRATWSWHRADSQETKFEQWKEKTRPPPLPPVDFDVT